MGRSWCRVSVQQMFVIIVTVVGCIFQSLPSPSILLKLSGFVTMAEVMVCDFQGRVRLT